ncbi:MAG: hypothetical protein ACM3ST_04760, partial [Bdellovibrio bacteriovorus]
MHVGLEIFPAVMGAVEALDDKVSTAGDLPIAVVHAQSPEAGRHAASTLQAMESIRGHPLKVVILEATELNTY